jgi:hypothetical protein
MMFWLGVIACSWMYVTVVLVLHHAFSITMMSVFLESSQYRIRILLLSLTWPVWVPILILIRMILFPYRVITRQ